ncbi:SET domain-containing protein [Hypoxylon trugodes]|uniref:SET domain-containing protein n=1 Tax=Hypoxylon trugodes TaxID=326681 RepID=UPI00219BD3D8|nr:SET domain-containing protein [Hypoxylon trugodes]KAI1392700.1 SET domain-containing protein [Hypoxylon trugodes]
MSSLSTVDGIDQEIQEVQLPIANSDATPLLLAGTEVSPLSSDPTAENKTSVNDDSDGDNRDDEIEDLKKQMIVLVAWLKNFPRSSPCSPTFSTKESDGSEDVQLPHGGDGAGSATSDGQCTPSTPDTKDSESIEESSSPNTSYEVEEPTVKPHHLVEDEDAEDYGEIPIEHLANPEKYSNQYIEVRTSQLGGNGIFAKTDLESGQLILVERPMLTATPMTLYEELENLAPELRETFYRMHGHKRYGSHEVRQAIFLTNAFCVGSISCVYSIGARFNHACNPINSVAYRVEPGCTMEFRVNRDVPAGTELTVAYGRLSPRELYILWGFRCACGACKPLTDRDIARMEENW